MRLLRYLFFIFSGLVLGGILILGRESLLVGALVFSKNAYLPRFLDKVYLVVFGLIWLVAWFGIEGYYVEGERKKILWPRFLRVTGIELILVFFAQILVTLYAEGGVNWLVLALLLIAPAAGVGLLIYAKRLITRAPKIAAQGDWSNEQR